ncbi:MAG TPA: HpcH/HpaI aldolase/citrate lyase family protein [Bacilli bacterium]|nr:HpcH/HpaI aldolase/citrate lyase family protein [Bacilli bacterium]
MRYFSYLSKDEEMSLFYKSPTSFSQASSRETLSYAVGAALYSPATRQTIAEDILRQKHQGLVSMVFDLEDAIGDHQVEWAEETLLQQLFKLASYREIGLLEEERVPLLFIRVRSPEQLQRLIGRLEDRVTMITGFFFPKFSPQDGEAYYEILDAYNRHKAQAAPTLYGSPILESAEVIYAERRQEALTACKAILDRYRDCVLGVRIGATDFSSLFGLRRSVEHTVYDLLVIRDCIADVLNVFGRVEQGYVVSGPVWEYFSGAEEGGGQADERLVRTAERYGLHLTTRAEYGLLREVLLDKENGIIGKTVIHPSHIKIVQALHTVTHEEYKDAIALLEQEAGPGGVMRSEYANKMNEIKPHLNWAKRTVAKANIYGVLHEHENRYAQMSRHGQAYV